MKLIKTQDFLLLIDEEALEVGLQEGLKLIK